MLFYIVQNILAITPLPKQMNVGQDNYSIGKLTVICRTSDGDCGNNLQPALNFYEPLMFPMGVPQNSPSSAIGTLLIQLNCTQVEILPIDFVNNNETYTLNVRKTGVFITALNQFGAVRALATLAQLVQNNYRPEYSIPESSILDFPAHKYRAVMVDSARHFLPLQTLKRQVAALSVSKMSVLHLHEPDSQSFPLLTKREPANKFANGAWVMAGERYYHTLEELRELSEYAVGLGVFIMLEFDMPGHAASWASATPEITCQCRDVINPANELTYKYIESFIEDVFEALYKPFGFNPMIHLGGDEVQSGCFNADPHVKAWMVKNGYDSRKAWQYLHQRVVDIIINITSRMYPDRRPEQYRFYWQESFSNQNNLTKGGVMHAWMNTHEMQRAANEGIFIVRSQGWYLDLNQPGQSKENFVDSWEDFYKVDVTGGVRSYADFVLGGGACQWGEKVHNGNIDEQIWPRSIAVAEVLWSNPASREITLQLRQRLNGLTCYLRKAGVNSGALVPSAPCAGVDMRENGQEITNWRKTIGASDERDYGWGGRGK